MNHLILFAAFALDSPAEGAIFRAFDPEPLIVSAFSQESVRPAPKKPTYESVLARVLLGETVEEFLDDFPGQRPGRFRCYLRDGVPSYERLPEPAAKVKAPEVAVADRPFSKESRITRATSAPIAGPASTGSAGGRATASTFTPVPAVRLLGGTSAAVPCLKG